MLTTLVTTTHSSLFHSCMYFWFENKLILPALKPSDKVFNNFSFSTVVKGVVCKKNVAHRRMISKIEKSRLLILGGALEYQRVSNHLSSFDTLLQQVVTF